MSHAIIKEDTLRSLDVGEGRESGRKAFLPGTGLPRLRLHSGRLDEAEAASKKNLALLPFATAEALLLPPGSGRLPQHLGRVVTKDVDWTASDDEPPRGDSVAVFLL